MPDSVSPLLPSQFLSSRNIKVNSALEQEGVRKAAKLAREVLDIAASKLAPGVTTDEIDKVVFDEAIKRDCYPSPLGYHGYPKSVCTSVNEVICHGIPDQRRLEDGDIINLGEQHACALAPSFSADSRRFLIL